MNRLLFHISLLVLLFVFICLAPNSQASSVQAPLQSLVSAQPAGLTPQEIEAIMQQDIRDIAGVIDLAPPIYPWVVGGILATLLIAFLLWLYSKRKHTPAEVETPADIALKRLTESRILLKNEQTQAYAKQISQILRDYISSCFPVHATTLTTDEFFHSIQNIPQKNNPLYKAGPHLAECLRLVDMIKFAKHSINKKTAKDIENTFRKFIVTSSLKEEEI